MQTLWPSGGVIQPHITSPFGPRDGGVHSGCDFIGFSTVRAIAAGRVVAEGRNALVGWIVTIDHGGGIMSRYCHMAERSPLRFGDDVALAAPVGLMGATGSQVKGKHLHLDVYVNGVRIDPVPFITARLGGVPAGSGGSSLEGEDMFTDQDRANLVSVMLALGAGGLAPANEPATKTAVKIMQSVEAQVNGLPDALTAIMAQVNGAPEILARILKAVTTTSSGGIDIDALVAALRQGLGTAVADELSRRLAS